MKQPQTPMKDTFDFDPRQIPAGALLIWDDARNVWVPARLTQGSGVTITSANGAITISAP